MGMDMEIKNLLGFNPDTDDEIIHIDWQNQINSVCKPCWELKYCPYGRLVEDFPLLPPLRSQALKHNDYFKQCIETGFCGDGIPLDEKQRKFFETSISTFRAEAYHEKYPSFVSDIECTLFGHICPIFFVSEAFQETEERRSIGKSVPVSTKIQVVRRDDYTCQSCGTPLGDDKLEFDYKIPVSKGNSMDEQNIQLICFYCLKKKSNE